MSGGSASSSPTQVCFQCGTGFYLSNGACTAYPDCNTVMNTTGVSYLIFFKTDSNKNQIPVCQKCPVGCLGCSLSNPQNPGSQITCASCDSSVNYAANALGQCVPAAMLQPPTCSSNQFAYIDNTGAWSACQNCGNNCDVC